MREGGYEIDIVVQGYPGKSVCHGTLGWCSIVLLRGHGRTAVIDTGSFGMRKMLIERLAARGLAPPDVTDLLLTHSHYDHSVNWTMFHQARVVIGDGELDWALTQPWGLTSVPELYVRELDDWETLHRARNGEEVLPNVWSHPTPGHTPGHLLYVLRGEARDIIFAGDAAKNRAELLTRTADLTMDAAASAASIEAIWSLWTQREGNIVVPGHDVPMVLDNGVPRYIGKREAAISAWLGEDLERTTLFSLIPA